MNLLQMQSMILDTLRSMALKRPVFHSEADFQFEFAWALRERGVASDIRLERPYVINDTYNIDLVAVIEQKTVAFELKYLRPQKVVHLGDEAFDLKFTAKDLGRYYSLKDIVRLEEVVNAGVADCGYVIVLSCESGFWNKGRVGNNDDQFGLYEGRRVTGTLDWHAKTGLGTRKGRPPLCINGEYTLEWHQYAVVPEQLEAKVLVVEVTTGSKSGRHSAPKPPKTTTLR